MDTEKLALFGGDPAVPAGFLTPEKRDSLFRAMVLTGEAEDAALDVIRRGAFSDTEITVKFEEEFAAWQGAKYALCYANGTMSLAAAMFALGLGEGDEIICPTKTYWASISPALGFGAVPVFCNVTDMLSMDPDDLERCIGPRTKVLMVVHYLGYPCDMDRIMEIARKHGLKVIEDVSHGQGGHYKGKKLGSFGDIAAMSLMSCKSFAAGELGILVTDDRKLWERAVAYGHYDRNREGIITESEDLKEYLHIPLGGVKGRANQVCTAIARDQLIHYEERIREIRRAMNRFWDLLEGLPGIRGIRVDESTGSDMAGFYYPHGAYYPDELGGLSVDRFCEAVTAEIGESCHPGANYCLHTHPLFKTFDWAHRGKPARIAFAERDVRPMDDACEPSTRKYCFSVPRFNYLDEEVIGRYAAGYRKVIENYRLLLEADEKRGMGGAWHR